MIFIPVKWLPWIMVIVGAIGLFLTITGEVDDPVFSFFVSAALIGGGILWIRHGSKKNSGVTVKPPSSIVSDSVPTGKAAFCKECGSAFESDGNFCENCGAKRE